MSVARFIADQRTEHGVPHRLACRLLGVSEAWFYKWNNRLPSSQQQRRAGLDAAVRRHFEDSHGSYGSPRVHADLVEAGWRVSVNTVADSMRRQQLVARAKRRPKGCTKADQSATKFPDLLRREFTAAAPNRKWCGDITEIPTDRGKCYLATVIDLYSRRLLGAAISEHPNTELAIAAITMAATLRGGREQIDGVIFHSDHGATYTANAFTELCRDRLGIRQSMGRIGSCFDNAAAEAFFATLEHEVLSRHHFTDRAHAKTVVIAWCYDFYNTQRRHSAAAMMPPTSYENLATQTAAA